MRHGTLLANALVHAINDGYVAAIYPILPLVAIEFHANYAEIGLVKLGLTGALGLFELPAGLAAERVGENLVLGIGTVWLAMGFLAMGLAGATWQLAALATLAGAGGATQHPLSASLVSRAYPASRRATAIGTLNFSGDVGKAIVPLVCGWLAVLVGWRQSMLWLGLAGLPLVGLFALLSRRQARERPTETAIVEGGGGWGITDPPKFATLALLGVLDSGVRGAALTLLPFLLVAKGLDTPAIGSLFAIVFVAGAVGKFGCGPLGDRFGMVGVVVVTELATALAVLAFVPAPTALVFVLAGVFGFFLNGTSSVLYAAVAGLVSAQRRARGYALYYSCGLLSGAAAPVLYGFLADQWGLTLAFALMAAGALLTLPLASFLREPATA
ncbi:MAG: MFS transporter [Bacteroidetes bacterium]|nr:MFS transporter [Bacteroidota bacterium]MCL5027014.1 MFS transporter [Chloroflexota bacterium]